MKTKVFGYLLLMLAIFMMIACGVSGYYNLAYGEKDFFSLLIPTLITLGIAVVMMFLGKKRTHVGQALSRKDSFLVVAFVWVIFSLLGMLPYLLYGTTHNVSTAFFEAISGFTSSGATAFNNIDIQPHGILFWRAMTMWVGGLGIIVFSFALVPVYELKNTNAFSAEVTGITIEKLQPRIESTAKRLLLIYTILTFICALAFKITAMNVFDAVCHAMSTISTGGFSTHQESFAYFESPQLEYVAVIFMFLGSVNFSLFYYLSVRSSILDAHRSFWKNEEFRIYTFYLSFMVLFFFLLMCWILLPSDYESAFRSCLFHVVSIASSSGFQATNFDYVAWGDAFWMPTMILMFVGACAGSTGGGVKMIRVIVCLKNLKNEVKHQLRPHAIYPVRLSGKILSEHKVSNALTFIFIYFVLFVLGSIFLTTIGIDADTAIGSSLSCLGNVGPAMGIAGPSSTYATMPDIAKIFLSIYMLIGRLELYTLMFIFVPDFWKQD